MAEEDLDRSVPGILARLLREGAGELGQEERERAVLRACGDDRGRSRAVLELLALLPEAERAFDSGESGGPLLPARGEAHARYEVRGEIARGGMGRILAVYDQDLECERAMKVIAEDRVGTDPTAESRFVREARVTAALDHPGIVPVHELGTDGDRRLYYTMKRVAGEELGGLFRRCRAGDREWTRTRLLDVLLRVCEAVAFAHSKGVTHRDLKPANVMVGPFGEVYVMDWGLAAAPGDPADGDAGASGGASGGSSGGAAPPSRLTAPGDLVGTPGYMSPEQAAGDPRAVGPPADVYAAGAMLYELLAGTRPYAEVADRDALLRAVRGGRPAPLATAAPGAPPELVAIAEKAMAREPGERYGEMAELARDLRSYLDGRVVAAYESGFFAEARKWVARHRVPFALAALLVAVTGIGTALSASLLSSARAESRSVARLSALQDLERLRGEAEQLWPLGPERVRPIEAWLERAEALVAEQPSHEARLAELREWARPRLPEEVRADRESHPEYRRLTDLEAQVRWLEIVLRTRRGGPPAPLPEPDWKEYPQDWRGLVSICVEMIDGWHPGYGDPFLACALAQRAVELAPDDGRWRALATLAYAQFAAGRDADALASMVASCEATPAGSSLRREREEGLEHLRQQVADVNDEEALLEEAERVIELKEELAELRPLVSTRRTWRFAEDAPAHAEWWHNQLSLLLAELTQLRDRERGLLGQGTSPEHGLGMGRRLALSLQLQASSAPGGAAHAAWEQSRDAIRAAYPDLDLAPQMGLVPLGPYRRSGLWEFWHVPSGERPERDAAGELVVTEETGLVFVLVPGGEARLQTHDGWRYTRTVELAPFFISKYELTQGQYGRWTGERIAQYAAGVRVRDEPSAIDLRHPVEQLSWERAAQVLGWMGLDLPTEAQWEYAARGGSPTPWWSGDDPASLEGAENLDDRKLADFAEDRDAPAFAWSDGHAVHAPVGSFRASPFGLHDVHGNVSEWCRDAYGSFHDPRRGPARERVPHRVGGRVFRGGNYTSGATTSRVDARHSRPPHGTSGTVGVRPVRAVDP